MINKLPISAMIVGYNEEKLLPKCLASIDFCDEILYTDLGSTDNSIKIAEQYKATIYKRNKANVPSCEMVQTEVVNYTKNDWVVFIDPDEVVDKDLQQQIRNEFDKISKSGIIGAVTVPWQFYFKNKKLLGTVWGGSNKKFFLVNKYRFDFLPIIHYGRILKKEFSNFDIIENKNKTNILHHYWMNSYEVFLQKHKRYLKNEGKDNYNAGIRMGIKKTILTPFSAFIESFINRKGYKDGFAGLFLSIFWAYYKTHIALNILQIQIQEKKR